MKKKMLFFVSLLAMSIGAFAINKTNCCSAGEVCEPKVCCADKPNCCNTKALSESDFNVNE